jgi:thiosulfate dehydrogenase
LTDTQIWQVSLLLANADKPMPQAAMDLLGGDASSRPVAPATPSAGPQPATK